MNSSPRLDPRIVRSDFPILTTRLANGQPLVYLDNAATSQCPRQVIEALVDVYSHGYANVHRGIHDLSEKATELFERSREHVRRFINAESSDEIVFTHMPEGSAALARNQSARKATGDWLIFLDADDELADGYVDAMRTALEEFRAGATLFTPRVSYVQNGRRESPKFWPEVPYQDANWLVIGTMIYRGLFYRLGGFKNYGDPPGSNAFEDWGLWALAQKNGATVTKCR